MIDERFFAELQTVYNDNINMFKEQNSGLLIEQIFPLTIEAVAKAINAPEDVLVDKNYINEHYVNFTINPHMYNVRQGYTTRVDIVPDISWEIRR